MIWVSNQFSGSGRIRAYIFGFGPELVGPFATLILSFDSHVVDDDKRPNPLCFFLVNFLGSALMGSGVLS